MSTRYIIGRSGAARRWTRTASAFVFVSQATTGCQWILNDVDTVADAAEESRAPDGNEDGGAHDSSSRDEEAGAGDGRPGGGDTEASDGATAGAASDAGRGDARDAGGADATGSDGPDAASTDAAIGQDASIPAPDGGTSCATPLSWYEDDDKDGYGRASSVVQACSAPAGGTWVRTAGDCNDDDERVYPGQQDYFRDSYRTSEGAESFDYDCSGNEEGNGRQAIFTGCGLLGIALCTEIGYLGTLRAGASNPACGSDIKVSCSGGLLGAVGCNQNEEQVVEPYWCR